LVSRNTLKITGLTYGCCDSASSCVLRKEQTYRARLYAQVCEKCDRLMFLNAFLRTLVPGLVLAVEETNTKEMSLVLAPVNV